MKKITEANINPHTKVFVRIDMDVPMAGNVIEDATRLESSLETLKFIIEQEGTPVIAGHMGRPNGTVVDDLSTKKLLPFFNEHLGEGNFELLENLRFDPREKGNDEAFAKELAEKAEIYVNESFATCHREHASIVGVPKFLPAYAGFRLEKEISTLKKVLDNPDKPLILIVGGAKIDSKKPLIENFLNTADKILVGGKIGLDWNEDVPEKLILPEDYAENNYDIGPITIEKYLEILNSAKTVIWAGPLGMFEEDDYFTGTKKIAQKIAEISNNGQCFSIAGGGDTVSALNKADLQESISFISTGGSAMLEFLATGTLLGIEVLKG